MPRRPAAQVNQLEQSLRESEKRYKLLLDSVTDYTYTVVIQAGQPVTTFHSASCATVTGYTPAEYQADPYLWYRMVYPDDRAVVSEQITQVQAGQTPAPIEHRIIHKDGSLRWVRNTSVPRYDAQGRLVAYDGLVSDITERKQAEEQLRGTLKKTAALYDVARSLVTFESVPDLLQTVTDRVAAVLPADRVILILFDCEAGQVGDYAIGGPGAAAISLAPFAELMGGLSGWALRELQPVLSPAHGPDSRESPAAQQRRAQTNCGAVIVAPMYHRGQPLGTLTAINRPEQPDFTWQDVDLVLALVHQMAVALENARLFAETTRLKAFNESIVQNSAEAILIQDTQGRYTFANPAAAELLGYPCAELIGLPWQALVPAEYQAQAQAEAARWAAGHTSRYETVLLHKAGHTIPVMLSARPLFAAGQFTGALTTITDITPLKQAEAALAHERDLLHVLMNNVPDTIYFKDTASRFTRINAAQARWLGLAQPEQAVGRTDADFFTADHSRAAYQDEQEIIHTGQPLIGKLERIRRADGEFRWVSTTKMPITNRANQVTGIVGITRDITDQIQIQNELQARNEELDAFAHTVAHDLKHELALMVGISEMLETAADRALLTEQEVDAYLAKIAQRGRKMSNIIQELLVLSNWRHSDTVDAARLDMAAIVGEAQDRLADLIRARQAEVIAPAQWPATVGYAPWVEEVWVNYLSNALKYGGSATQPPRVEIGATPQADGMVRCWVRDNGPGLTPPEMARLFKPFERLAQVRAKGHGLGLSIVRRIVEKLGGQVGVTSQVGQGSVFSFTLPAGHEHDSQVWGAKLEV